MNCKRKSFITKRKAFTLIELLIVIAIIGILFIVLVSKVDFATDKAKTTGVQTDFRSFQLAFETVSRENAGFNTFGWDTGDLNANGKRDSYDEGDANKDGKQDAGEVWTGHKVYAETFTKVFSLVKPGTTGYDRDALNRLETAINANLDPKLHITIKDNGEIVMANGAQDPWNKEYHGEYITNAEVDKKDRGAIVIYSDGANNEFGSEHSIANGIVSVSVPGNNKAGKDDYGMVVVYTYVNGYGETATITEGFSNNQFFLADGAGNGGGSGDNVVTPQDPDVTELLEPGLYESGAIALASDGDVEAAKDMLKTPWSELLSTNIVNVEDGVFYTKVTNGYNTILEGDLVLPNDDSIIHLGDMIVNVQDNSYTGRKAFYGCYYLNGVTIPSSVETISDTAFTSSRITRIEFANDSNLKTIDYRAFYGCPLEKITIPDGVHIAEEAFYFCSKLSTVKIGTGCTGIGNKAFSYCKQLTDLIISDGLTNIDSYAFEWCENLTSVTIPDSVTSIGTNIFDWCRKIENLTIPFIGSTKDTNDNAFLGYFFGATEPRENETKVPQSLKKVIVTNDPMIEDYAFWFCKYLEEIVLSNKTITIGHDAFAHSSNIETFVIPDSVTSIGSSAFYCCSNLKSVTIGSGITHLPGIFSHSGIVSVTIPDNVTSIDSYLFNYCNKLLSIDFGNGITNIGQYVVNSCDRIFSVTIGRNVTNIESNLGLPKEVVNNSSLDIKKGSRSYGGVAYGALEVHSGTSRIVNIDDYLFYSYDNTNSLLAYAGNDTLLTLPESYNGENYAINVRAFHYNDRITSVTIPDSVTSIGDKAFYDCPSLASVTIGDGVTSIGDDAFMSCDNLTNLHIGNQVTSIGDCAFNYCTKLTSIVLPVSIQTIYNYAFSNCKNVESVVFEGTVEQWNKITKYAEWNKSFSITEVVCTDGIVSISSS